MKKELMGIITCIILISVAFAPRITASNEIKNTEQFFVGYPEYGLLADGMTADEMVQQMVGGYPLKEYYGDKFTQKQEYVPGELIVKFKDEVSLSVSLNGVLTTGLESIDKLNEECGVISVERLFGDSSPASLSNIYMFTFSEGLDVFDFLAKYNSDPNVEYAELNYIGNFLSVQPEIISGNFPNDPYFDQQWGLHNTGQTGGTSDADIDAPEAWDIETGSSDVIIAIVDSGVDYTHDDLADNIWINEDEIPDNDIDDDGNGFVDDIRGWDFRNDDNDPIDDYGHGTHCAGIAGAVTNNDVGIAGVCWNCKIMAVQIGSEYGIPSDAAAQGITYAVDNGADVISMSWGFYSRSNLICDALDYAYVQGVVLVAAAGNAGNTKKFFPSGHDNVISVAATDSNDEKASFSNYGEWVDVAAPGVNILSLRANGTDFYEDGTHIVDEYYYIANGTSMSGPFVAGLAGLLLSEHPECPYPVQMVRSVIPFTADEVDFEIGGGRINAYNALDAVPFAAVLEEVTKWEDIKGAVDISGTAWGEDFQYFVLEYGKGENPETWTEMVSSSTSQQGILYSWDTTQADEGLYTVRLRVICDHGIHSDEILIFVNNEADGTYDADIYVSNCYDSSTPGWGKTRFDNINDAINKSKIFDTIFVYDGFYSENIEFYGLLKSSISLIGQSKNYTIIDGNILINEAIKVTVSGFNLGYKTKFHKIDSPGWLYDDAIIIYSSSLCTISDNKFSGCYGEYFVGTEHSTKNAIKNNIIDIGAIYFFGGEIELNFRSSKIEISGNKNLGYTILLSKSHSNIIKSNTFCETIWIWESWNNLIYKNKISSYPYNAVHLEDRSFANKIVANSLTDCYQGIISDGWDKPMYNQIYLNNFERNVKSNAVDNGNNLWYNLGKKMGNYWDDYTGADNNGDGIGDTPYAIPDDQGGSKNKDMFPLMEPVDIDNVVIEEVEEFISEIVNEYNQGTKEGEMNSQSSNPLFFQTLQRLLNNI